MTIIHHDAHTEMLVEKGRMAFERIGRQETWADWLAVGLAIDAGRQAVMRHLRTNNPVGRVWSEKFGAWLAKNGKSEQNPGGFAAIDKGVRSRLQSVIDDLPAVEAWRESIGAAKSQQYQHPVTVWRHYSSAMKPKADKPRSPAAGVARGKDNLQMSVERLEQIADQIEAPKQLAFDLTTPEMIGESVALFIDVYGEEAAFEFAKVMHAVMLRRNFPEIVAPVSPDPATRAAELSIDQRSERTTLAAEAAELAPVPVWENGEELIVIVKGDKYRISGDRSAVWVEISAGRRRAAYFRIVTDQRRIARVLKAAREG